MKALTTVIHFLLLSSTFLRAETGKLEKSPIDGLIEITCKGADGTNDRHFINASQVVRVFTKAAAVKKNGDRYATAVVITTSEVEIRHRGDGSVARSVQYYLSYKIPRDADEAVNQILAELRSALGKKKASTSEVLEPESDHSHEDHSHDEAEQDGAEQAPTAPESK